MKKNGFVSISLVYTFFVLFLILMTILLNSYTSKRYSLETYKSDIQNELIEMASEDINLYIYVYNNKSNGYELNSEYLVNNPTANDFQEDKSFCVNNKDAEAITYAIEDTGEKDAHGNPIKKGNVIIKANSKDTCFAYFGSKN